jgi:hypothetical protein
MPTTNPQVYGQTPVQTTAPGATGSLPGNTYEGSFSNSLGSIPALGGSINSLLSSLYGSKPATANPATSASQAIQGNAANLRADTGLTLATDTTSAAGAQVPFQLNLPDYENMLTQDTGNVGSELQGQVPQDVQNLITEGAAERGIQTGQGPSSPNSNAALLQALGLTSIGQMQTGQSGLSTLIGETPTGAAFNPSTMFVTPEQQQAADQYANLVAAAPDPEASGLLNTVESFL